MVSWSPLGLTLREGPPLVTGFAVAETASAAHDERYTLVVGKTREARDHYRELRVTLRETASPFRRLQITLRAYDDGVAFQYTLPAQGELTALEIVTENTQFRFPEDMKAWAFQINTFRSSYEGRYLPTRLSMIPDTGLVYPPLTMQRADATV